MGHLPLLERLYVWLAWKVPRRFAYWCWIRLTCDATTADSLVGYEVPAIPLEHLLREVHKATR